MFPYCSSGVIKLCNPILFWNDDVDVNIGLLSLLDTFFLYLPKYQELLCWLENVTRDSWLWGVLAL